MKEIVDDKLRGNAGGITVWQIEEGYCYQSATNFVRKFHLFKCCYIHTHSTYMCESIS